MRRQNAAATPYSPGKGRRSRFAAVSLVTKSNLGRLPRFPRIKPGATIAFSRQRSYPPNAIAKTVIVLWSAIEEDEQEENEESVAEDEEPAEEE
jgi:hypothetical protein